MPATTYQQTGNFRFVMPTQSDQINLIWGSSGIWSEFSGKFGSKLISLEVYLEDLQINYYLPSFGSVPIPEFDLSQSDAERAIAREELLAKFPKGALVFYRMYSGGNVWEAVAE